MVSLIYTLSTAFFCTLHNICIMCNLLSTVLLWFSNYNMLLGLVEELAPTVAEWILLGLLLF